MICAVQLRLKDAGITGCSGMSAHGHDEKGEWLKITHYDEDGADVSERFRLQTPAQRTAFRAAFYPPAYAHTGHPAALDHRRCPRPASLIATPGFCRRPHERPVLASA